MRQFLKYFSYALITLVIVKILVSFVPYSLAINMTESLPQSYFFVSKRNHDLRVGDYIMFNKPNKFYQKPFIKIIGAVAGDVITRDGENIYNGKLFLGKTKSKSVNGIKLNPAVLGEVKQGEYYVYAPHIDSLDSRYEEISNIESEYVIGKAYPINLWGRNNE